MRVIRYNVAMSLDGFIADANGRYDWITQDPTLDFGALWKQFDTIIMGRKTFEAALQHYPDGSMPGIDVIVFSGTLRQGDYPKVTIESGDVTEAVMSLKRASGKDIWLFGGGKLFRTLLDANLVDRIELAVMPVLLGKGIPVLPPGKRISDLHLTSNKALPTGIVLLSYGR